MISCLFGPMLEYKRYIQIDIECGLFYLQSFYRCMSFHAVRL